MALTLSQPVKGYLAGNLTMVTYQFTAAGSGDTLTVSIPANYPDLAIFTDANGNTITSSPPTFGTWTTTGGLGSATLTANSGGVVTNGHMVLIYRAN